jgi:amino acid adenylation domain-containing protein
VQVIAPVGTFPLDVFDLRSLAGPEQKTRVAAEKARIERTPFNLATGPVIRAALIQLADEEYELVIGLHHISTDLLSTEVFLRELDALYEAFSHGQPSPLEPLPIQYADFAIWQRDMLRGEVLDGHVKYWREQLSGLNRTELPADFPRPPRPSFRGRTLGRVLPRDLVDSLTDLSRREGATPFMTFLTALKVLLLRYTGVTEIVVGGPIANRDRPELENLIGFFVNTLVFRTDLSGNPGFREALSRVRGVALSAFSHQDLPFERLVEELAPERDLSRTPFFQVMFQQAKPPSLKSKLAGSFTGGGKDDTARFDLEINVGMSPKTGTTVSIIYSVDLFEEATIERLLDHYVTLLQGIAANPDGAIENFALIGEAEQKRLATEWNQTDREYPRHLSVHAVFEAQAARAPDAVAVQYPGHALTYAELNAKANRLAGRLRKLGVGPGALVGLCVERSVDMVVSMLGILKAGGAYVPLDSDFPLARLEMMLTDTGAPVVLTQRPLKDRLPTRGAKVLLVDDPLTFEGESEANPSSHPAGDATACVIYTSGSTGTPKGVCIPHRGISRLVLNTNYMTITPEDRVAQASSSIFDAATFEIWGALLNGCRLVGILKEVALTPSAMAVELRAQKITILFVTTALLNQLAREPGIFAGLRYVFFGGEQVDPKGVRAVLENGRPAHLVHAYGPCEATTYATCYEVTDVPANAVTVPIGRAIANTRLYVLDAHRQLVPVGLSGELYIGGDGVAPGYWRRPELTAERFIPDSFGPDPNGRLYRTGDRVRLRADGALEFLGRHDQQVKVRGFRIELGEIESVLGEQPAVQETLVLVREDSPGDKRVVAYVVPRGQRPADELVREWRAALKVRLPAYMVPAHFVLLERFPINVSGKVDRKALPAPEGSYADAEYVAPSTDTERQLAALWSQILHVERIGIHDNFFELGGHSLIATQVLSRIRDTFHVDLPLRTLFEAPTIAGIAQALSAARTKTQPPPITRMSRDSRRVSLPASE